MPPEERPRTGFSAGLAWTQSFGCLRFENVFIAPWFLKVIFSAVIFSELFKKIVSGFLFFGYEVSTQFNCCYFEHCVCSLAAGMVFPLGLALCSSL